MKDTGKTTSDDEIEKRRDAALKRALSTPHKPHKPAKKKRTKEKPAK